MGNLKPGATYIYERDKGTTYAREFGADPNTRKAIGWDYNYKNQAPKSSGQIDIEDIAINFDDAARMAFMQLNKIDPELAKQIMVCSEKFYKIAREKMKELA